MRFYVDWTMFIEMFTMPVLILIIWIVTDRVIVALKRMHPPSLKFILKRVTEERQREAIIRRASTFHGLLFQVIRLFSWLFFTSLFMWSMGVNLAPILTGVGVMGLAISLGAQNIFRDFLNGFFIITEDQFNVGDWIDIDVYSGTVEDFNLRLTRLRSIEGRLIMIPNSAITQVVNHTKEWAVAKVDIGTAYGANTEEALVIMQECAEEVHSKYAANILEKPVIQGIIDFRPNDVLLRALIKTVAGSQWEIGREYRRMLKQKFDERGIDIPIPQLEIHRAKETATGS